eukprot:CAMPEP_0116118392 /NCGR_PEP_ID=MMETSP0329-20121206/2079_1 /TAXON_ID=697910 /ORGANISM="Pseudo-nitzschia arenysensis, Strain B593" /LENGTH=364 /DNA_ID=CAMNT_0003612015 /DNA_START=86 /DNA_END=1180 /DNA_ORIENTATION=-
MIDEHPTDFGSENDTEYNYSSNSFRSTSTPMRNAKKKIHKIKKMVADNEIKAHSDRSEEVRLRIHAKIEEQKAVVRSKQKEQQQQQEREATNVDCSSPSSMMLSLSEDIEKMELEAQKLMEELECAKQESAKPKQQKQEEMTSLAIKEGFDQEFLESRITELEVENEILTTRLQSGQATVDSIRADISNMASSNQEFKKALREAKAASEPLQTEQENLRSKLQKADEDLQVLETRVNYKRTAKKVEKNQKEVFEQAAREILDLQRNHRLKKQISQRKIQQKQQQKQKQQQMVQPQNSLPQQTETKPLERTIKRQSSWWQLDTPEKGPKKPVSIKNIHAIGTITISEDTDLVESESSDIDTVSER